MKVFVYYNLHKKLWSIKCLIGPNKGRVVGHAEQVCLCNVEPKVSAAGRRRVLKERKKNVHAGIVGWLRPVRFALRDYQYQTNSRKITYNPYLYDRFVYADNTDEPFEKSGYALLDSNDRSVTVWSWLR